MGFPAQEAGGTGPAEGAEMAGEQARAEKLGEPGTGRGPRVVLTFLWSVSFESENTSED